MKKIITFILLILFSLPAFADNNYSDSYFDKFNDLIKNYEQDEKHFLYKKDVIFYSIQKELEKLVYEMNEKDIDNISQLQCNNYNNKYSYTVDNRSNKIDVKVYYAHGLTLNCSEAMSIFSIDYNWLKKHYGKGLSKEYKQWLKYLNNPVPFEEGQLNTNQKNLNKQKKNLEKFIYQFPQFVGIEDVKSELNKLKNITPTNH